jgi:hypothetical protein
LFHSSQKETFITERICTIAPFITIINDIIAPFITERNYDTIAPSLHSQAPSTYRNYDTIAPSLHSQSPSANRNNDTTAPFTTLPAPSTYRNYDIIVPFITEISCDVIQSIHHRKR